MKYHMSKKTKELKVTINKKEIVIGKDIGKVIFEHNDNLIYLCNSKYHYDGDLYIYEEGGNPICIMDGVTVKPPDYNLSIILLYKKEEKHRNIGEKLYYYDFERCKLYFLNENVGKYNLLTKKDEGFEILYGKVPKEWSWVNDLYLYNSLENKSVKILNGISEYLLFMNNNDNLKFVCFSLKDVEDYKWGSILVYNNGKVTLEISGCYYRYLVLRDSNNDIKILFGRFNRTTSNFNDLIDISLWEKDEIKLLAKNVISDSFTYYRYIDDNYVFKGFQYSTLGKRFVLDGYNEDDTDFDFNADSVGNFIIKDEIHGDFVIPEISYIGLSFIIITKNGAGFNCLNTELIKGHNHNSIFMDLGDLNFYVTCLKYKKNIIQDTLYVYKNKQIINKIDNIDLDYEIDVKAEKLNNNGIEYNNIFDKIEINLNEKVNQPNTNTNIIKFYYSCSFGQYDNVIFKIGNKAYKKEIMENEFEDDDTINYIFYFNNDQVNDIALMNYALHKRVLPKLSIYNIEINYLLSNCYGLSYNYQSTINNYKYHVNHINNLIQGQFYKSFTFENYEKYVRQMSRNIIGKLMKKHIFFNESELYEYLLNKYYRMEVQARKDVNQYLMEQGYNPYTLQLVRNTGRMTQLLDQGFNQSSLEEDYYKILSNLIVDNIIEAIWKSEADLFKLVYSVYPDSIMHYSPIWLGLQHYDIFIPSCHVAIEYQGRQHYEPIEFFGGKENYEKQIELDDRKKVLSIDNKIELIYWRYDEPINKMILNEKLKGIKDFNFN